MTEQFSLHLLLLFQKPEAPENFINQRGGRHVVCETKSSDFPGQVQRGWPWLFIGSSLLLFGFCFEGPLGTAWSPNAVPLLIEPRGQFSLGWCGVLSVDLRPQGQILRSLRGLELGN